VATLVFLYNLKHGTDRATWEEFVRREDIPLTVGLPSVRRYSVYRIDEAVEGDSGFQYMEIMEVTNREALAADMKGDAWQAGMDAMYRFGLDDEIGFAVTDVGGE
jgi:hypothetical protein